MMQTEREIRSYVQGRGYDVAPVINSIACAEGAPLKVVGYELHGPRGNKGFVPLDRDGSVSRMSIDLWCDGVDYATARIAARRS